MSGVQVLETATGGKDLARSSLDTCLLIAPGVHGYAICLQMQNCTSRDYRDTPGIRITRFFAPFIILDGIS